MKVTFEGSEQEIARIVLAAFGPSDTAMVEPVQIEPVVVQEPVSAPVETETETAPIVANAPSQSIRSRVLEMIIKYPSVTANEIASTLGLDHEQVRAPVSHLIARRFVEIATGPDKTPFYPNRLVPTKTATRALASMLTNRRLPVGKRLVSTRSMVTDFLKKNPGSTSTQVAAALRMATNNISAALTTMNKIGTTRTEGAGGSDEPFRYSLA